jgi:transposase
MLTDGQWTALELRIEACRPVAKVAPQNLHQTMSAIVWRHQNGARWRAVPEVLGPWWKAVQTYADRRVVRSVNLGADIAVTCHTRFVGGRRAGTAPPFIGLAKAARRPELSRRVDCQW